MNAKHIGWGLLALGGLLAAMEIAAQANADISGESAIQSIIGKIESTVPNPTPFRLGTVVLLTGATVLWVWPLVKSA